MTLVCLKIKTNVLFVAFWFNSVNDVEGQIMEMIYVLLVVRPILDSSCMFQPIRWNV